MHRFVLAVLAIAPSGVLYFVAALLVRQLNDDDLRWQPAIHRNGRRSAGLFERHGKVESVKLINDRETGRPRGFAFVDMAAGDAQTRFSKRMASRWVAARCASTKLRSAPREPAPGRRWWRWWRRLGAAALVMRR